MAGLFGYDKTASNNNNIQGIVVTDGVMRTSAVDNCFQAITSDLARYRDDQSGQLVSTGTGGSYAITSNSAITAYATGMRFHFEANHSNTGAATLNVDLVGAKAINKRGTTPVVANEILQGGHYIVEYDASEDAFIILNSEGASVSHTHTLEDITDSGALAALNTVNTSEIDDDAVTFGKLAPGTADVLRGHDGSGNPSEVTLGTGLTLTGGVLNGSSGGLVMNVQHQNAGNGGSSVSGSWQQRPLTEVSNTIPGASLAANVITLPAGTYKVVGYQMLSSSGEFKCRIRDTGDTTTYLVGSNAGTIGAASAVIPTNINGVFALGAETGVEFEYYCTLSQGTTGLGRNISSGETNVYADLMIEKVA